MDAAFSTAGCGKEQPIRPAFEFGEGEDQPGRGDAEENPEGRAVHVRMKPDGPTEAAWILHSVTHYPFRNWCPHCVSGRAKSWPDGRVAPELSANGIPEVSFDYSFLRDRPGTECLTV